MEVWAWLLLDSVAGYVDVDGGENNDELIGNGDVVLLTMVEIVGMEDAGTEDTVVLLRSTLDGNSVVELDGEVICPCKMLLLVDEGDATPLCPCKDELLLEEVIPRLEATEIVLSPTLENENEFVGEIVCP